VLPVFLGREREASGEILVKDKPKRKPPKEKKSAAEELQAKMAKRK